MPNVMSKMGAAGPVCTLPATNPPYGRIPFQIPVKEGKCGGWVSWLMIVLGPLGKAICDLAASDFVECWNAFWQGGDAWTTVKAKCDKELLAIEIGIIIGIAVITYFLYPYFSTAIDYGSTLRNVVNTVISKIWAPIETGLGWAKSAVGFLLSWMDPIAAATQTSPILWKINLVTLILWGALVVSSDAEGLVDGFFSGEYGAYGEHVYEVFSVLSWPERKAVELASGVWSVFGLAVAALMTPFEIAAFMFSLPVALVLYPVLELARDFASDAGKLEQLDPDAAEQAREWVNSHKKTSGDHNDAVPSAVPERVCSGC